MATPLGLQLYADSKPDWKPDIDRNIFFVFRTMEFTAQNRLLQQLM